MQVNWNQLYEKLTIQGVNMPAFAISEYQEETPEYKQKLAEAMVRHWRSSVNIRVKEKTVTHVLEKIRQEFGLSSVTVPVFNGITFKQADKALHRCNSFTRLEYLIELMDYLEPNDWYKLAGDHWTGLDNIYEHSAALQRYFIASIQAHKLHMMNAAELAVYDSLPDMVTIYRGCSDSNKEGLCWSLAEKVARKMTSRNRYEPPGGSETFVLTETINKSLIVAVKLDKNGLEIIRIYA